MEYSVQKHIILWSYVFLRILKSRCVSLFIFATSIVCTDLWVLYFAILKIYLTFIDAIARQVFECSFSFNQSIYPGKYWPYYIWLINVSGWSKMHSKSRVTQFKYFRTKIEKYLSGRFKVKHTLKSSLGFEE